MNATNQKNQTALLLACQKGNINIINALHNAGADPNIADTNGDTCLHKAVTQSLSKAILQGIIDLGAELNVKNNEHQTALALACEGKKEDAIHVLLNAGANPNIENKNGNTCLHEAVTQSFSAAILQAIIDHGAEVNVTNQENQTGMLLVCKEGNTDLMNIFLNAGGDPSIDDIGGNTCLHFVARKYCYRKNVIQAVIDLGADVNATNHENQTALLLACEEGNTNIINALRNAGADPNIADVDGNICLHYVARHYNDKKKAVQAVLDLGADMNATNHENQTALLLACEKGNTNIINALCNAGADPNIADIIGNTCLHYAARSYSNGKEDVQAVIDLGADVNATNHENQTALLLACEEGNTNIINALHNAGADPDIADVDGNTCFHYVARLYNDRKKAVQAVIDVGADVNATNHENQTALLLACEKGHTNIINVLRNAGADPNIADIVGNTCLHYAARRYYNGKEAVQAVIDLGADVNATNHENETALLLACEKGNTNIINALRNAGADPNIADIVGNTCLHYAARKYYDSGKAVQSVIDVGVDVNATNHKNQTALLLACEKGNTNIINALRNAGADPNIADIVGNTCLHYATRNCYDKEEVVQTVIDLGVDVNATNQENETALLLACEKGNTDVIHTLCNAGADASIVDAHDVTCLQILLHRECDQETLLMLLDHDVPVNAVDKNQRTAYMLACDQGNTDAMCALVNAGADPGFRLYVYTARHLSR